MPHRPLRCLLSGLLLAGLGLSSTSCTVAKPVVCAVTTPVYMLSGYSGCSGDGRGLACLALACSAVGAASGLVTGIVSDINCLTGRASDPCRNLHDPFATNTSRSSFSR